MLDLFSQLLRRPVQHEHRQFGLEAARTGYGEVTVICVDRFSVADLNVACLDDSDRQRVDMFQQVGSKIPKGFDGPRSCKPASISKRWRVDRDEFVLNRATILKPFLGWTMGKRH